MIARRFISALVIALVISGVFTFWLSKKFAKPRAAAAPKQQYVAATANLEAGEILQAKSLKLVDWPSAAPLQGAFAKPQDVVGRTVLYPVAADEPIQERQLSAVGAGVGLTVKIPEGMRAISLRTDEIVGVAGYLLPGTHVDVLVTYKAPGSQDPITSTVLQDVEILTAGQKMQPDPEGKATSVDVVTLLVNPRDAERAVLASAQGTVHFVLRNGTDREQVVDQPIQLSALSGNAAPSSKPTSAPHKLELVAAPKTYSVETIAGGKQTVDTFQ
jgi:pilus assembly protein CpaB